MKRRECIVLAGGAAASMPRFVDSFRQAGGLCRLDIPWPEARRSTGPAPTKFHLMVNLKAALGLEVTSSMQARADEVIE